MDKRGLVVGIVATVLLLGAADRSSGVIVRFSLDGENAAPDGLDVLAGESFTMYVVSFSPGEAYDRVIEYSPSGIIGDVLIYPEAGDLASVSWPGDESFFWVSVEDSMGNIIAGRHFEFEVTVPGDMGAGECVYFQILSMLAPDDSIVFTVVPEPGTVALLSLGGLLAFRRRRSR